MFKTLSTLAVAAALASGAMLAAGALPASAGSTPTKFTLTSGELSISVPNSSDLGSTAVGSRTLAAQMGSVTVTDQRGSLADGWIATASSSDFTTGGGTAAETIDSDQIDYSPGSATAETGSATFTPGTPGPLYPALTAFSASSSFGDNSCTWDPTLTVNIPAQAIAGVYSGTVTHSVS